MTPTQKRNKRKFAATLKNLSTLSEMFPKAFPQKGQPLIPLKVGTADDLKAEAQRLEWDLSETAIQRVLSFWCSRPIYLKALERNSHRIDLQGNPAELISQEEKQLAKKRRRLIEKERAQQAAAAAPTPEA